MRILTLLVSALVLAGCATHKSAFNSHGTADYLATHQDRPARIKDALSAGRLADGMNEEEVLLCWGKANKILTEDISGVDRISWGYFVPRIVAYSYGRTIWADALVKEVTFTNGVVMAWKEIK